MGLKSLSDRKRWQVMGEQSWAPRRIQFMASG